MDTASATLFPINAIAENEREMSAALGQYMTPRWAAELLFARFFADAHENDLVCDPTCGDGAWLAAVPANIPSFGIEIDPTLAERAATATGRSVIVGDIKTVTLRERPTILVGNPPFTHDLVQAVLERTKEWLPIGGRAGYLLPAYTFANTRTTMRLLRGFTTHVDLIPKDLFPCIAHPLIFARLTRTEEQRLIGFCLYEEAAALRSVRGDFAALFARGRRPMWREIVETALTAYGGEATLSQIYSVVENYRPSTNPWWREAIRRELGRHFIQTGTARYSNREIAA